MEAYDSRNLCVEGTELFDCTYGLVELSNVDEASFRNCTFRDSKEFSMFSFHNSHDVILQDCQIFGNHSDSAQYPFISAPGSWKVRFENCEFKENTYHYFLAETDSLSMERIKFENCLLDGEKL